jgi:uncharacterized protein (TIGR00730 family)
MADRKIPTRVFPRAKEDAAVAKTATQTPQTANESYKLAFQDTDFLLRDELRPVRIQLELMKVEMMLEEANIGSTFVMYGSARIPEREKSEAMLRAATTDKQKLIAERLLVKSKYYDEARKLAQMSSQYPDDANGKRQFVVCSGGGPSIMEAANRGAADVGKESIGLNIVLPFEQTPNAYVTPSLSFHFHYFALRKMHFLMRARAVAAFPGGFGTFDELFELLTLIQTGKMAQLPIFLFGREFWEKVVNFEGLVEEGVIAEHDLNLFRFVETAEEAWEKLEHYYATRDRVHLHRDPPKAA